MSNSETLRKIEIVLKLFAKLAQVSQKHSLLAKALMQVWKLK